MLANLIFLSAMATLFAFVLGFAARAHWMLELLTHFRVHYAAFLLIAGVLLLLCAARWQGLLTTAAGLGIMATLIPLYWPSPNRAPRDSPTWRLVSVNVHAASQAHSRLLEFLDESQPDVVVGLEINDRWAEVLLGLKDRYPHQKIAPRSGNFGVAILSRFPLLEVRVEQLEVNIPTLVARIEIEPGNECTVFAVHPVPPVSASVAAHRNAQLQRLAELVKSADSPIIAAGDFNATSWSPAFADFAAATGLVDSRNGFGVQPTWSPEPRFAVVGIPIDHALISPELRVANRQVGRDIGSDHRPILVDFERRSAVRLP